jgi:GNAT superfamily N-acetyltransferase
MLELWLSFKGLVMKITMLTAAIAAAVFAPTAAYQKHGIGKQLLQNTLAWAKIKVQLSRNY